MLKEIRGGVADVVLTALRDTSEMEISSWWTTRSQQLKGLVLVERLIWAITEQSPFASDTNARPGKHDGVVATTDGQQMSRTRRRSSLLNIPCLVRVLATL